MVKERYSHDEDWSWAMLVMLKDVMEGHQSCLSNAPLRIKQDTTSIEQ